MAASLDDLRTAQDRLIQTEKLASLGQLTAGIAHEIKNPLNFVNNFSALSAELVGELDEALVPASLDQKTRSDVSELTQMLKSNLEKVVQHGKRADSIVKNMLLHSREGSGEHRSTDINALVEESLNLAYHGARAEKPGFNITLQTDFDLVAGKADIYPQEITRVLLNLISNGFYAATRRAAESGDRFEPTILAATKSLGDEIEIRIRDNGTGIAADVKPKIFNPFFRPNQQARVPDWSLDEPRHHRETTRWQDRGRDRSGGIHRVYHFAAAQCHRNQALETNSERMHPRC